MLRAEKLRKVVRSGNTDLVVLDALELEIEDGEMVAIVGPSGSGKSTLLEILGTLDIPSSGEVYFKGVSYANISEAEKGELRNRNFGFVWQLDYLLPEFTALENVAMPLRIRGLNGPEAGKKAEKWLARVGLKDRASHRVGELSGGEQQRAALARALVSEPQVLMADEPTGNLDTENSRAVLEVLRDLNERLGQTILMITHNPEAAAYGHHTLHMRDGKIIERT